MCSLRDWVHKVYPNPEDNTIAAPDQREWVPILCPSKPRQALPMVAHAARRAASTWCEDICSSLLLRQTMQTDVSSIVPGYYVQIHFMRCADCKTGQWVASSIIPVNDCLLFLVIFLLFKCHHHTVSKKIQIARWHQNELLVLEKSNVM
jgi:hypothetical protein